MRTTLREKRNKSKKLLQPLLLWQVWLLCWLAGIMAFYYPLPSFVSFLIIIAADSRLRGSARLLCAAFFFCAGWIYFYLRLPEEPRDFPEWLAASQLGNNKKNTPQRLEGLVENVQGLPGNRLRIFLSETRPVLKPEAAPLPGLLMWVWEDPTFTPGKKQKISVALHPKELHGSKNPGVFDPAVWWSMQGVFRRMWSRGETGNPQISGPANAFWRPRDEVRAEMNRLLERDGPITQAKAVIPAILFGDRRYMEKSTLDLFASATLIHSLALSGQHLILAGIGAAALIFIFGRLNPGIFQYMPRNKLILFTSLPLAAAYVWLGDAPPSIMRSLWMMFLLALWLWREKPCTLADCLFGALLCMSLADPVVCHALGFQLSVLCIAAIALSLPAIAYLPKTQDLSRAMPVKMAAATSAALHTTLVSLVISIALLPLSVLVFGTSSPWFFLNIIWLPFVELWVMPASAAALAATAARLEAAAKFFMDLAALPGEVLLLFLQFLAGHGLLDFPAMLRPHWSAVIGFGAAMTAAALLPGRAKLPLSGKRLLATAIPLLLFGPLLRHFEELDDNIGLRLLDVGQGQAVVLELPRGKRLLVDGGGVNSANYDPGQAILAPILSANRAPFLEYVFNSHPDTDHLRGLFHILERFSVKSFMHNADKPKPALASELERALKNIPSQILSAPLTIPLGPNLELEVLHPPAQSKLKGNNASIVLRLTLNKRGLALLPGDIERAGLEILLASGRDLRADVLILPHHGSGKSLNPAFYKAVSPKLALISSGYGNSYGLPSASVLDELKKLNIMVLNTAINGQIFTQWDENGVLIRR